MKRKQCISLICNAGKTNCELNSFVVMMRKKVAADVLLRSNERLNRKIGQQDLGIYTMREQKMTQS